MNIIKNKTIKLVYGCVLCVVLLFAVYATSLAYASIPALEKPTVALETGQSLTPTFSVTIDDSQKNGVVQLFSDNGCSKALSERKMVASSDTTDIQTHTLTSGQSYSVYAKHILPSQGGSQCSASGVNYEYGIPEQALEAPSLTQNNTQTNKTPSKPTFTVVVDSSQKNGVVQLFSNDACSSALSERKMVASNGTTDIQTHTLTSGQSYTIYAQHTDKYKRSKCSASGADYSYATTSESSNNKKSSRTASKRSSRSNRNRGATTATSASKAPATPPAEPVAEVEQVAEAESTENNNNNEDDITKQIALLEEQVTTLMHRLIALLTKQLTT